MHRTKLDQYRKQIRKQQLNEYFKKRRKQLTSIPNCSQSSHPMQTIHRLNAQIHKAIEDNKMINQKSNNMGLQDLATVAKFTQTEFGVECLLKTDIPVLVLPFLTPTYYNRLQQHMATCIFVNITYMRPQKRPSDQFLRNITNILQNTSTQNQQQQPQHSISRPSTDQLLDTIDNCLLIIYHLMVDFSEVIRFYVQDCELPNLLYGLIQTQLSLPCIEKILKVMTFINQYYLQRSNKKPVRRFLKFYLNILSNTNQFRFIFLALTNVQSLMSIYCQSIIIHQHYRTNMINNKSQPFTQTQKEFSDIQSQIQKSHFLSRITALFPHISKRKLLSKQLLSILRMLIPGLGLKTIQQKLLVLLGRICDQIYSQQQQMCEFNNENQQQHHEKMRHNGSLMQMRLQFYQVVYQILSIWGSQHQLVTKNNMFANICHHYTDFQSTHSALTIDENQLRKAFIYIFGMLTFSGTIPKEEIYPLKVSIEKYRKSAQLMAIDDENQDQAQSSSSSFEAFIDTVLVNIDDYSHSQYF